MMKIREKLQSSSNAPDICRDTDTLFVFEFKQSGPWTLDLRKGEDKCYVQAGFPMAQVDCTIKIRDEDFVAMLKGEVSGQSLVMSGKMKLSNMMVCKKLGDALKSLSSLVPSPATE